MNPVSARSVAKIVGVLLLLGLAGCAQRYNITLSSGHVMTTSNKPKYDRKSDTFRFKNPQGKVEVIPSIRVREIEPQ